ncbi:hypothetical protein RTO_32460 [[Ruminococcus] torques L2-14]|jgi:hypothetical protein|uniref:Uncharacterized protein n=1 Tax=[Ruminococcus] torques L2-14 TaxID=657313 RepID=D4M0Q8_9FIRM|nr:hypothetical protein RTO_32460 [[Ruminococcus] torques L2-14]
MNVTEIRRPADMERRTIMQADFRKI